MGFLLSPFLSPFAFGFMVARARQVFVLLFVESYSSTGFSWRWVYGIGSIYGAIVLGLIVFFAEET